MVKAIIDSSYKFEFERSPLFFMRVESREVQNSSDRRDVSLEYYWDSAVSQVDCTNILYICRLRTSHKNLNRIFGHVCMQFYDSIFCGKLK